MEILLIVLITLTIFNYAYYKKDFLSPSFIGSAMFTLSCFLLICYADSWGVTNWSIKTSVIILVSLIALFFGEFLGRKIKYLGHKGLFRSRLSIGNVKFKIDDIDEFDYEFDIATFKLLLCNLVSVLALIIYARESYSMISGYSGYETTVLMQISDLKRSGMHVSTLAAQLLTISNAIALLMGYFIIKSGKNFRKLKFKLLYILPIIIYILTALFTSGRSIVLNLIIAYFFMWAILYQREKSFKIKSNLKIIRVIVIVLILMLTIFYYAGTASGKSSHYLNIFDNIANYMSSSLYALNQYVLNPGSFRSNTFFGIHTFSGLYTTLRTLGLKIPSSVVAFEYIPCGYIETNIYTALRRYYQDFGIIGTGILMFTLGFIYSRILKANKQREFSNLVTIYSAYVFSPIVFLPIEERFFMDVFSITTVYIMIYVAIIFKLLTSHRKIGRTNSV